MVTIDLSSKVALVTGASQGIGESIAATLHAAGAAVGINYFDDPEGTNRDRAEAVAGRLGEGRAWALAADVREPAALEAAVAELVERGGGLDILVNNAGIIRDRSLAKMSADEWHAVVDTNLTGVFHACKAAEPALRDGGRIVNLSSIAGIMGFFGQANYAAAKAGVIGMTRVLSRELARRRITVNAIAPGMIHTQMAQTVPDQVQAKMKEQIPLGDFGEPQDIAHAALFLASDLGRYVTGQTLQVNGGWIG